MRNHSIGAILLALATSTCASYHESSTLPRTEKRKKQDVQRVLDSCVELRDTDCYELCRQVFEVQPGQLVEYCKVTVEGDQVSITGNVKTPPPASSDRSGDSTAQGCAGGRRPLGLTCPASQASSELAAYLAGTAQLEAASVVAFARIHRAVAGTASPDLLARIRAAITDELAHARIMLALARAYGAEPPPPVIAPEPALSLVERAIENAVEGCVHETIAALHAAIIAAAAPDPAIRAGFALVVEDEGRHALLAYDLAAHYARGLDARDRARVALAYRAARAAAIARRPSQAMRALGIPDDGRLPAAIATLLDAMPITAVA